MVHLVYCDNEGKKGERVLDKIIAGTKTMVVSLCNCQGKISTKLCEIDR